MSFPELILLFSGKRKCGKDFISEKLHNIFGNEKCCIIRISEPIKSHWAQVHNLDLQQLMGCEGYKEKYRKTMIEWSDKVRGSDPGFFCKAACQKAPLKQIWIVSDVRRKTDVEWFIKTYGEKVKLVRITADEDVRRGRGWKFTEGVDDVVSECGLDDYTKWDLKITNNSDEEGNKAIEGILNFVKHSISIY